MKNQQKNRPEQVLPDGSRVVMSVQHENRFTPPQPKA